MPKNFQTEIFPQIWGNRCFLKQKRYENVRAAVETDSVSSFCSIHSITAFRIKIQTGDRQTEFCVLSTTSKNSSCKIILFQMLGFTFLYHLTKHFRWSVLISPRKDSWIRWAQTYDLWVLLPSKQHLLYTCASPFVRVKVRCSSASNPGFFLLTLRKHLPQYFEE